jgi:hypothetical protein
VWAPDGSELFYVNAGRVQAVRIGPDAVPGDPRSLFAIPPGLTAEDTPRLFDVHPDGRRFAIVTHSEPERRNPPRLNVILNWPHELAGR